MSHPAWIGNWTQPPGMVGSNGTAGFSSRRMPCILLLEKPVLVVVWLQCNIGLRHSAFGVGGLAEDTPSAPTEPRTCTWGEGVAYATKATHSRQRRACCKATFLFGTMMRRKQCAAHSGTRTAGKRHSETRSDMRGLHLVTWHSVELDYQMMLKVWGFSIIW